MIDTIADVLRQAFGRAAMKSREVLMEHVLVTIPATIPEVLDVPALPRAASADSLHQHHHTASEDEEPGVATEEAEGAETDLGDLESDDSNKQPLSLPVVAAVAALPTLPRANADSAPPSLLSVQHASGRVKRLGTASWTAQERASRSIVFKTEMSH
ncbi:hypothetical protein FOCC_FOCC010868 [Frankliniella occidentalis]|nr:hypothetical protein FOCC_FOCC010868 [Frankliniella occidentalis]